MLGHHSISESPISALAGQNMFTGTLPLPVMSGVGIRAQNGAFSGSLPLPVLDAESPPPIVGAFAGSIPLPVMSAFGSFVFSGTFGGAIPLPVFLAGRATPAGLQFLIPASLHDFETPESLAEFVLFDGISDGFLIPGNSGWGFEVPGEDS